MNRPPDDQISKLLQRLERWLMENRAHFVNRLPRGATKAELEDFQSKLGMQVPPGLRVLLSWHNGQGHEFIGRF